MKRFDKISIINLFNFLGLTTLMLSCQTKVVNKDSEVSIERLSPPPFRVDTAKILKEGALLDYVTSAKTVNPNPKNGVPFSKLEYDKVIAYDFKGDAESYASVLNVHEKFVPVILGQQYLTQQQSDKILSTLAKNSTYGESAAICFSPHFALVLYKDNKKVNQINICLDCNHLLADIEIPAISHKKFNRGTKDEYPMIGFSKSGRAAIIDLCKELNFFYGLDLR